MGALKRLRYVLGVAVPFQQKFLADGVLEVDLAGDAGGSFALVYCGLIFGVVWTEGLAERID